MTDDEAPNSAVFKEESPDSQVIEEIRTFIQDNVEFRKKGLSAFDKIDAMINSLGLLQRDTRHLLILPEIAKTNSIMSSSFSAFQQDFHDLKTESFAAIVGKKQVPLSIFLIVVATLAIVIVLLVLGQRYIEASATGVKMGSGHAQEEKKTDQYAR